VSEKLSREDALKATGTVRFRVEGLGYWGAEEQQFEGGMVHEIAKPSKALRTAIVDAARAEAVTPGTGVQLVDADGESVEPEPEAEE
jgi:hypothetical protein